MDRTIIEAAHTLATLLPTQAVDAVSAAVSDCVPDGLLTEISKRVPHHHHRELAIAFIEKWRTSAPEVEAKAVAVALQTAALAERSHRDSQSVELVWTGPDTGQTAFRRTEQAILQVLDAAKAKITLVSFAVYRIPNVARALVNAAKRGVRLTVIVETPDRIEGQGEYSTIRALGQEVANCATVYFWPKEKRPTSDSGKPGILHVKTVVADAELIYLSSANLTQQAFTINMELGVLIRGGAMPARVEAQFARLIQDGVLVGV